MKLVSIKQEVMLSAAPHEVFEMLMDQKKHADFTGGEAKISRAVGGSFVTFDGWANGKNLALVPDKKIVQSWRGDDWPEGHFSKVTFQLLPAAGSKTKLVFTQMDVPSSVAKDIAKGWKEYYWKPMQAILAS